MAQPRTRFVRSVEPRTLPPMSLRGEDFDNGMMNDNGGGGGESDNTRETPSWRADRSFINRSEKPSIRVVGMPERGSQRSFVGSAAGGGFANNAGEQGSRAAVGVVKVGEVLSKNYDLTVVDAEDRSSVLATIQCIVTLEERVPELEITVGREPGYYAILVRGFDEFIDIVNWHNKVRMSSGNTKMRLVHNFLGDPGTGILTVRVGMRETGAVNEPGLPSLPLAIAPITTAAGASRKRDRSDSEKPDHPAPKIDYDLAKSILASLRDRCNMDDAEPGDVHRLLSVLYHATMLDAEIPLLEVSPVRRDESGSYVMTCRGFISKVDFDQVYEKMVASAANDDALRTLLSVAYNVSQGTLELCVQGGRPAGPGKRRRAGQGDVNV